MPPPSLELLQEERNEKAKIVKNIDDLSVYDLIFADPPYDNPQYELIEKIVQKLAQGGILVLSHPKEPTPPTFDGLELLSDRSYAGACIKIYFKQ